ncbi:MAG: alpha/beta fold hydrolase [Mesorhizobium sp.]|uniref:alpha/beta fold hydrolase n=1 Tax=Mesorhizobium sp. TaxID=1871066 RepID=UPI001ACE9CCA|nr:alpha/beta fold hydrolase [Mesorhizobium sp.]MBN9217259.1 alpha/beta fold hydrolase [Mesorhizobium sp.]
MIENDFYSQANHGPYELHDIGDLALEEGGTIRGCKLAVATHGRLNEAGDNAILVPTWFSGTNKIMEQVYVGPGRALDPQKHFIVIVNQIGGGLSTSPHNVPQPSNMARFPLVRIGDDVRAQHKLLTEVYGVESLALVFGASMGAQQAYEWAVRYPDMVKRAAPVAGTARNTDHDFIFTQTLIDAITSDPGWNGGWYRNGGDVHAGLRRHAALWAVMGWSTEFYKREIWRGIGFSSREDFVVNFMEGYFLPMDPNALLSMAWKWQRGDVGRVAGGDLAVALGRIKAKTYVMPISTDMFFPPSDCHAEQKLIPGSEFRPIESQCGHFGLIGVEQSFTEQIDRNLRELLASEV